MKGENDKIIYRVLSPDDLVPQLLDGFDRYQEVTKCWRRENGEWVLRDVVFTEQWGRKELLGLTGDLLGIARRGGFVCDAEQGGRVIGIASLDSEFFGSRNQYLELCSIHVSAESRGKGVGRTLFGRVCDEARRRGAKKLYISAHSSAETQAFYHAMGCVEAEEYSRKRAESEPCDVQMELVL